MSSRFERCLNIERVVRGTRVPHEQSDSRSGKGKRREKAFYFAPFAGPEKSDGVLLCSVYFTSWRISFSSDFSSGRLSGRKERERNVCTLIFQWQYIMCVRVVKRADVKIVRREIVNPSTGIEGVQNHHEVQNIA